MEKLFRLIRLVSDALTIWLLIEIFFFIVLFGIFYFLAREWIKPDSWRVRAQKAVTLFNYIASRPFLAIFFCFASTISICALYTCIIMPYPEIMDEFSNILGAYTFAEGRLTNPTHPMWHFFETFHVFHLPSYQSKFPPANALFMAFGIVTGGHPIVGVWVSFAMAVAALCWMLQALVPHKWALAGALGAAFHGRMMQEWGLEYWGGAASLLGGALLFGALARLQKKPNVGCTVLFALGLLLLANHRPFEGLITALIPTVLLIWLMFNYLQKNNFSIGPQLQVLAKFLIPGILVFGAGAYAMLYYNMAVTGSYFTLPYTFYGPQYEMATPFIFKTYEAPEYRHEIFKTYAELDYRLALSSHFTVWGLITEWLYKMWYYWRFYFSIVFTLPLIAFIVSEKNRADKICLLIVSVLLISIVVNTYAWPHYISPIAALFVYMVIRGMMNFSVFRQYMNQYIYASLKFTIIAIVILYLPLTLLAHIRQSRNSLSEKKELIEKRLKADGSKHIIMVRYSDEHDVLRDWVYNGPDLENGQVLWAREMEPPEKNKEIVSYYANRKFWLFQPDKDPDMLIPYELPLKHPE
ncbi:MAG: hypothetical protein JJU28_08855 [Cyclobacteriaceae bacterium]|nr:hypothetical protein [Cyclobacteriaceae bacterium]